MRSYNFMRGYVYILQCCDGSYYTGSTQNLMKRVAEHQAGSGANYTAKKLPLMLVYFAVYNRIDTAFKREKQIQGWSHRKKEALIGGDERHLHLLSVCKNETHFSRLQSV